jgi:hypothetical protein
MARAGCPEFVRPNAVRLRVWAANHWIRDTFASVRMPLGHTPYVQGNLAAPQQITDLPCIEHNNGNALGPPFIAETQTMTLVNAYLARSAQHGYGGALVGAILRACTAVASFGRVTRQAFAEAREMQRVMRRRYPHLDL